MKIDERRKRVRKGVRDENKGEKGRRVKSETLCISTQTQIQDNHTTPKQHCM